MMKNQLLLIGFVLAFVFGVNSQTVTVSGNITSNTTWTNNNIYILTGGFIYVKDNAVLTIQPGTLIKSTGSTLVVTRGSRIEAVGTQSQPIVFTSNQPAGSRTAGDWGGVYLLGNAPINDPAGQRLGEGGIDPVLGLYGGTNSNDNSGTLKYVRIEFAGVAYLPNNETNGLTMGGVGSATTIDYVQVSNGGDDAFEWFGGTVNCKHLVANRTVDDMFDTDYGYSGRIQFAVGLSDSTIADISGSNGFESDNDATGTTNGPLTKPIITNVSLFGPRKTTTSTGYNSNFKRAAHIRRSSSQCIYNSMLVGWPVGLKIENTTTGQNATTGTLQFRNNIIAGSLTTPTNQSLDSSALTTPVLTMNSWFNSGSNTIYANPQAVMAVNPQNYAAPNFLLQAGSPALTGASFSYPNLNNSFFETTTYRGAFDGTNDWTKCWTNWDPQNTPYTTPGVTYLAVNATPSGALTFCQGGSVVLTSSAASNNTWSNSTTSQNLTVTTSGTYTVTTTNAAGCVATSAPIVVVVNPLPTTPTITAGGATTFCQGGTVALTSSSASNNTWNGGVTTASINVASTGNYSVTVTDANGCTATSAPTVVTVNALPATPTISANGPTTFCTGGSVTLTSSASNGVLWSTNATTPTITVTTSGTYTVTVTDVNNCSAASAVTTVNVGASPIPTINATATTACTGDTITLTASTSDSYLWSNGATTPSIDVTSTGNYTVTVTNANACNGVGTSDQVVLTFTQSPVAAATYSTSGTIVTFTNTSTNATSYSWDFGDFTNSSAASPSHAYTANGSYVVTLTATNGNCTDVYTTNVSISASIEELSGITAVTLFPNPATDNVNLELNMRDNSTVTVSIVDNSGKVVYTENKEVYEGQNVHSLNTSSLSAGYYNVVLSTDNGVAKTIKLAINK